MAAPAAKDARTEQFRLSLDKERLALLTRIADSLAEGSKSGAVAALIDLYGGMILERVQQERDLRDVEAAPREVLRWKAPTMSRELIAYISGLVRAGNMPEVAFQIAGVTPRQRNQWLKRGRNDRQTDTQTLFADLVTAIEQAEGECEAEDLQRLRAHGRTSWTALAWRLERQYPDRYAQRKRIDGKVQHSVFPLVDWDRLTPVETRTLVELLRKASPELDDPGVSRAARPAAELLPADVLEIEEADYSELEDQKPDA